MDVAGVVEAPDETTAQMWCELLKSNGIDAFPKCSSGAAYSGLLLGPFSPTGCWVMVSEGDLERATTILEPMTGGRRRRRRER